LAHFQHADKDPSLNDVSKIWLNGTARFMAQNFNKTLGIPFGPVEVAGLGCSKKFPNN
jgi:hypothetical protein